MGKTSKKIVKKRKLLRAQRERVKNIRERKRTLTKDDNSASSLTLLTTVQQPAVEPNTPAEIPTPLQSIVEPDLQNQPAEIPTPTSLQSTVEPDLQNQIRSKMQTENPKSNRNGIELEKFKRRMIRFVARKLKEKKPEEEMWKEMKKEIGSNGKKLWERMRMLTLKKLKRLLESDDRVEFIGVVARMTLTDWLLFDLVIVHEKIDVINREKLNGSYNSKVLSNLFSLVQRFEIEGRTGEDLAEAWTAATVYYNSKGHQCSPMMLQRRWYQIKELTRHKFYKFWYTYRGNQRALITAKQDSPDELQKAIALKYPEVITEYFPTWEERIEGRLVILPDELGVKMRQRSLMKPSDTSAPDVVLVEPHIETIDLGANSDEDDEPLKTAEISKPPPTIRIKSEPLDTGIDIDENMQQYENPPEKKSVFEEEIERLQIAEENFDKSSLENNDKGKSIVIEPIAAEDDSDVDIVNDQNDTALAVNNDEIVTCQKETYFPCDAIVIDDDETDDEASLQIDASKEEAVVQISNAREKEEGVIEKMGSVVDSTDDVIMSEAADELNMAIREISSAAEAGIKVVDEGVMIEKHLADSECSLEIDVLVQNKTTDETRNRYQNEATEGLPVISAVSSNGVKVEMETDTPDDKQSGKPSTQVNFTENDLIRQVDDQSLDELSQADAGDFHFDDVSNSYKIAEICSVATAGIKVENVDDVLEKTESLNGQIEQLIDDNNSELLPAISTITSEGFDLQNDPAVNECTLENDVSATNEPACIIRNEGQNEVAEFLPIISIVCSNGVKVEMETDTSDDKLTGLSPTEENSQEDDVIRKVDDMSLEETSPTYEEDLNFDNVPLHLSFADENIDFADDGIAYIEDDEDDIIKVTDCFPQSIKNECDEKSTEDTKNESQEQSSVHELAEEGPQKFDLKLLMYPVVYTTKLDDIMTDIDDTAQYEHVEGIEKIDKIFTLSKPISYKSSTGCKTEIDTEPEVEDKIEKGEDIDNACNVSDDDLFKDENRGSLDSDSESDSDFIDDSKKVKMSSYLLRKPKHRSYNPVILCKNPDFNTRLKKLSVGFFMSTRNRMLLQTCIPMTIDLTKAFENKLINGTLYLKDVPQVSIVKTERVIGINDNVQITSADLIQPTAVEQSMMSIDEPLEIELKKRMAERVRGINLPDISQVRRLNQHLLTAEVTPLRLGNETSQNPQSDPVNYDQNIKDDINNIRAPKNEKETSNCLSVDIPPISIGTDLEQTPPPLLVKNPQLCMQHNSLSSHSPRLQRLINKDPVLGDRSTPPPMVSIADSLLGEIISNPTDPVRATPPVSNISSGNSHTLTNANSAPDSVTAKRKIRKTYYPIPAWNKPKLNVNQPKQEQFHSDALLTLDTLYKMLSALDPRDTTLQDMLPKKKVKNKKKLREEKQVSDHNAGNDTSPDSVIDITEGDEEIVVPAKIQNSKPRLRRRIRVKKKLFCCFYSYKNALDHGELDDALHVRWPRRKHKCMTGMCTCCCKILYTEPIDEDFRSVDLDQVKHNVHEEQVQTKQFDSEVTEKESHKIKQLQHENKPEKGSQSPFSDYGEPFSNEEGLPVADNPSDNVKKSNLVSGIKILNYEAEIPLSPVKTTPVPKVRVYSGKSAAKNLVCKSHDLPSLPSTSQSDSHDIAGLITNLENTIIPMTETNVAQHELSQSKIHWDVSDKTVEPSPKTTDGNVSHTSVVPTRKVGRPRKVIAVPCLCRPNISNVKQGKIEITSGDDCALHTTKKQLNINKVRGSRVKLHQNKLKESKIILNKKIVTDETRPFFVGKGKILLTNIKMPSRKPSPPPVPQFINVRLPEGVQIVLLPNQTLTYVVAPGVILTPKEYALIPHFLDAIQQQMANTTVNTLPESQNKPNEIIDLDKNDIPPPSKIQETPNEIIDLDKNDTPEISMQSADERTEFIENNVTRVAKTMNIPDSTELKIDSKSNELTVRDFEKDIDSIAEEKDRDGEDFEMKIDILDMEKKNKHKLVMTLVEEENASTASGVDKPENIEHNTVSEIASETNEINVSVSSNNKDSASANQDTKSKNENTSKKSLLSDLMEMSGIMEEDLTPLPNQVETAQEPIILDTSNLVLQQLVPQADVSEVLDSPPKEFFKAQSTQGAIELMAVTSFFQLKYATDNNGKFFKLDLENGQLTSINVCIQRFNQQESELESKSVIDLTDDPDVSITKATEPKVPMYIIDRQIQKSRPAILNNLLTQTRNPELKMTILEKKKRLLNSLSNNLKEVNIPQSKMQVNSILKRTSNLLRPPPLSYYSKWKNMKKVTAKINLEDSDTPMEEEYLSSDSSDDEPLIHKAKRMRLDETQGKQTAKTLNEPEDQQMNTPGSADEIIEEIEMLEDVEELSNDQQKSQEHLAQNDEKELNNEEIQELDEDMDGALLANEENYIEEHTEETEDDASQYSATSPVPVPTNLLLSGGAFSAHNIPLNYSPNEADAQDDDCILGV